MSDTTRSHSPSPQQPLRHPPLPTPLPSMAKQAAAKRERRRYEILTWTIISVVIRTVILCRADEESTRAGVGRTVARFRQMYGNSKIALMQAIESSESDQEEHRRNPSAPYVALGDVFLACKTRC